MAHADLLLSSQADVLHRGKLLRVPFAKQLLFNIDFDKSRFAGATTFFEAAEIVTARRRRKTFSMADLDGQQTVAVEEGGKMSSLSRRACYKCGNVGHYAEVCSSSERLCYNCKQPGHESSACP